MSSPIGLTHLDSYDIVLVLSDNCGGITVDTLRHGALVPAIPTMDNCTFWSYTSVPQNRIDWWVNLPLAES